MHLKTPPTLRFSFVADAPPDVPPVRRTDHLPPPPRCCLTHSHDPPPSPRSGMPPKPYTTTQLRRTLDRALRQGDFAPSSAAAAPSSLSAPPPSGALTVWAYNQLIRRLGKADRLSDAFEVLDGMARLGVENNHETLEFATNAAIKEVEFETRAVSMKTLPSGKRVMWSGFKQGVGV